MISIYDSRNKKSNLIFEYIRYFYNNIEQSMNVKTLLGFDIC